MAVANGAVHPGKVTETLTKATPRRTSPGGKRCRNRPLAAWRRTRAVELATLGLSYDAIAHEVGYAHRATAYRAVHSALQERTAAAVAVLRQQELDRLDALQHALWERAMTGDVGAVLAVEKRVRARIRLQGLDGPRQANDRPPKATVVLTAAELRSVAAPDTVGSRPCRSSHVPLAPTTLDSGRSDRRAHAGSAVRW